MNVLIAGVDEAGRGPLAGSVISAAVILNVSHPINGLKDSKKLSEKKRLLLFENIIKNAISWNIGRAEPAEIDAVNILQATMISMQRAIEGLSILPDYVFIDGKHPPKINIPSRCFVKGDNFIAEISAASILAKVIRDREMIDLDILFPQYGFAQHKGYPTAVHLKNLLKYGPTPYHRKSFYPVQRILNNQ
ncbi:ribonuclease HII [Candidatus Ishikawella capsulata]|nr:ribonuclease HII [Candidatus Ishikawaella capsulata]